jgi:hypothetical protein
MGECDCTFTPNHFLELLQRERRWCELLITAILTRRELHNLDFKLLADDTIAVVLANRARWLRTEMETQEVAPHPPYFTWGEVRDELLEPRLGRPLSALTSTADIISAFEALEALNEVRHGSYKNWAANLLYQLWRQSQLTDDALRQLLLNVWRYSDFPCQGCPPRAWRAMFRRTGYLTNAVPKPSRPRLLWRGCTPVGRHGLSWTSERDVAEKFIDHWYELGQAHRLGNLYKTIAPPAAILAGLRGHVENIDGREVLVRPEYEFIIDARQLQVTLVETAPEWKQRMERQEARYEAHWRRLSALAKRNA